MDNDQALAVLTAKRDAVNAAINGLSRYRQEQDSWKDSAKSAQMAAVKADATTVGADLTTWTGLDA